MRGKEKCELRHMPQLRRIEYIGVVAVFITFKKWTALYLLTLLLLFAGFAVILWQGSAVNASKNFMLPQENNVILIIDPGHGGFDGGAVADDGTIESQINLAIGLQIKGLADLLGIDVVMTRQEDVSLDGPDANTVRQRKVSDLKNRVALVNSVPEGILVSIHQNSLPEIASVHGAQVFYNEISGAEELALAIQEKLNSVINDRAKEIKPSGKNIYLLYQSAVPSVLVECGFLSNPQETTLLNTQFYQTKVALTVFSSVLDHFG